MSAHATVHTPVMLAEVLDVLQPQASQVYIDATFGAGGYSRALLEAAPCRVVGIDRDPLAVRRGEELARQYDGRLTPARARFGHLLAVAQALGLSAVHGIAFDLGVSSPQLDEAERGFSFRFDGPLDMRMDCEQARTAADAVNRLPEGELADLLYTLGEERASRRIAAAIVRARAAEPIVRTRRLVEIVHSVLPRAADGLDSATRTFQALRIWVNDELRELSRGLQAAESLLAPGGRLVVVAFHSLEDRMVKGFLRSRSGGEPRASRHQPVVAEAADVAPAFRLITRRAMRPSPREIAQNPRARSARLRAAERTSAPAPAHPTSPARRAA